MGFLTFSQNSEQSVTRLMENEKETQIQMRKIKRNTGRETCEPIAVYLHFIIKRFKILRFFYQDIIAVAERNIVIKNKTYGHHIQREKK